MADKAAKDKAGADAQQDKTNELSKINAADKVARDEIKQEDERKLSMAKEAVKVELTRAEDAAAKRLSHAKDVDNQALLQSNEEIAAEAKEISKLKQDMQAQRQEMKKAS